MNYEKKCSEGNVAGGVVARRERDSADESERAAATSTRVSKTIHARR